MPMYPFTQMFTIIIALNIIGLDAILIALERTRQKCAILIALRRSFLDEMSVEPMSQANPNEKSCRFFGLYAILIALDR